MGYQVTFKPSAEKMEEYKPWTNKFGTSTYQSPAKKTRAELIAYCMKKHDDKTFARIYDDINFYLRMLKETEHTDTRNDAYNRWNSDENKELWYCGWQFSRPCDFDADDVVENTTEDLVMFTDVIQTPDYFENSEKFYDKYNEVAQKVDGFIEIMDDITIHEIIDDLDEFRCKYDDEERFLRPAGDVVEEGEEEYDDGTVEGAIEENNSYVLDKDTVIKDIDVEAELKRQKND